MRARLIAIACALAWPMTGEAQPSFDCNKASTPVEHTICGDAKLAAADRELSGIYDGLMSQLSGPAKEHLQADQRRWLDNRGKGCEAVTANCLAADYRRRSVNLKTEASGAYPFVSEQALIRDGKVDAVTYQIDARYPQLDGAADFAAVNKAFAEFARSGAADAVPKAGNDSQRPQSWTYDQRFELYRPGPDALSFLTTAFIFTGGAHGSTGMTADLIDLKTGHAVRPSDMFVASSPWRRTLSEKVREDLKKQFVERPGFDDALEPAKIDKLLEEPRRYLFKAGALAVIFNQYEVGSFAAGPYIVEISYDKLDGLLRRDGSVQLAPVGSGGNR